MPLNEVKNKQDYDALPWYIKNALAMKTHNPHGQRFVERRGKATRKLAIQEAVVRGIQEGTITEKLGIEILQVNQAYGRQGKVAIKSIEEKA